MRLLVCGGRDYGNAAAVSTVLNAIRNKRGIACIIQGGANGADRLAAEWGNANGVPVETFQAAWETHGRKAGPIRNQQMITEGKPDGVVAFSGGIGTANMIHLAENVGLMVWRI